MRIIFFFLVTIVLFTNVSQGTPPEFVKQLQAVRLLEVVKIDGILTESIYQSQGVTTFYQQEPYQGNPVSEPTEVWIAYDDVAIYVGARLKDSQPDSIYKRLSRRDNEVGADLFAVAIDSYHDHRNGFYFSVSAAGTQMDGILYNDDWNNGTWDGVWESKTRINEEGWCVEIKIPFSQLRFDEKENHIWGINFLREIGRKKEQSFLVYTPRNESGFVSRFPDLLGIENIKPPARFEARPYITAKQELVQRRQGDPFNSGSEFSPGIGGDFKLGIGSNLTLDATINPDFGQVEVDPAVVNLSDVETYYSEKRPFFIEGMNIFSFGQGGVNNYWSFNWSNPNLFYSRRVGRNPQRNLPNNNFAEVPMGTRILGAAKLTGKVVDGWNFGFIEALTNREYARIDTSGKHWEFEVEPLTSYTIGRVQKDFNDGKQGFGALATLSHRFFKDDGMRSAVNSNAFIGGVDGWTALDSEKEYMVSMWTAFSNIQGSKERILDLQTGWPHYYERPDAKHVSIDSNATTLSGYAGRINFNKQKGRWILNSALGFVSPGFEPSDLGFVSRTDIINYHIATGYKWNEPTDYYRYVNIYASYFQTLDFGGNTLWRGIWGRVNYQFTNYHTFEIFYDYGFESINNNRTRGGPLMLNLPAHEYGIEYYTDGRADYIGEFDMYAFRRKNEYVYRFETYLTMRPLSSLSVTIGPEFTTSVNPAQWVTSYDDNNAISTYGRRYIFADLNYKEFSTNLRVNWTLNPNLSFQLYIQPLFATGKYSRYKELMQPKSYNFNIFGESGSSITDSTFGGTHYYYLDPDGLGIARTKRIEDPNFNRVELRANAVLRWEYLPGSTLYLVWTQSRFDKEIDGGFNMRKSFNRLIDTKSDNIFMLKLTYWLGV